MRTVIDVFDQELLPAEHPIRDLDNVFLTPHVSGFTIETRLRPVEAIADDIKRFFADQPFTLAVPSERLKSWPKRKEALTLTPEEFFRDSGMGGR